MSADDVTDPFAGLTGPARREALREAREDAKATALMRKLARVIREQRRRLAS